jgi:exonuclease VII large subunit
VQDRDGVLLSSAAAARQAERLDLRFHDGAVAVEVSETPER